jgi:ATP-dependent protease HslVU (ClpYQ) ATPase subunit
MAGVRVETTGQQVRQQLASIITNQDLSRYIL